MSELWPLWTLCGSSFLSATLLPGNSEIVLTALLLKTETDPVYLVLAAVIGNTLGGLTNVIIGRLAPVIKQHSKLETAQSWLKRYGAPVLLLSWLPIIGDLLCLLAGWLRLPWRSVTIFIFLGKASRYIVIAWITLYGSAWLS